jgi:hypothetical protein
MSDEALTTHEADSSHGEHSEIHLPPNSFVPISIALSLACVFVGFVDQVRSAVGPLVWGVGLLWFIGSCVMWFLAARNEYNELPESAEGH